MQSQFQDRGRKKYDHSSDTRNRIFGACFDPEEQQHPPAPRSTEPGEDQPISDTMSNEGSIGSCSTPVDQPDEGPCHQDIQEHHERAAAGATPATNKMSGIQGFIFKDNNATVDNNGVNDGGQDVKPDDKDESLLCKRYVQTGHCSDPSCQLEHLKKCPVCEKPRLDPTNKYAQRTHLKECEIRHAAAAAGDTGV